MKVYLHSENVLYSEVNTSYRCFVTVTGDSYI